MIDDSSQTMQPREIAGKGILATTMAVASAAFSYITERLAMVEASLRITALLFGILVSIFTIISFVRSWRHNRRNGPPRRRHRHYGD